MASNRGTGFLIKDGHLMCDSIRVKDVVESLQKSHNIQTPVFVYCKSTVQSNIGNYKNALASLDINEAILGFSIKANHNPTLLKLFADNGCYGIAVSGNEIRLALQAGIPTER